MRADAMLEKGGMDGQRAWKAIVKAIEEMQQGERKEGERVNTISRSSQSQVDVSTSDNWPLRAHSRGRKVAA